MSPVSSSPMLDIKLTDLDSWMALRELAVFDRSLTAARASRWGNGVICLIVDGDYVQQGPDYRVIEVIC